MPKLLTYSLLMLSIAAMSGCASKQAPTERSADPIVQSQTQAPESSTNPPANGTNETSTASKQQSSTKAEEAVGETIVDEKIEERPPRDFETETLYDLLVAEIAGKRQRPEVTLGNYVRQANRTRDPGVTARAARIARVMQATQVSMQMAKLWADVDPENPNAQQMATLILLENGEIDEALEHLQALLDSNAVVNFDAFLKIAFRLDAEQRDALRGELSRVANRYADNADIWFTISVLAHHGQSDEEALYAIKKSIDINPKFVKAQLHYASLLRKQNDMKSAVDILKALAKDHPDNKSLQLNYIQHLLEFGSNKAAKREIASLAKQFPQDGNLILSLALIAYEKSFIDEAEQYLKHLLKIKQRVDEANVYLGRIAKEEERIDEAIEYFQAVEREELYPDAQINIALIAAESDYDLARRTLREARQEVPQAAPRLYLAESELLTDVDEHQAALELLNEALMMYAQNDDLLYGRAMVAIHLDQLDIFETDMRSILRRRPDSAMALNALGYTLLDRNIRLDEAEQLVRRAYAIKPEDAAIIDSMGWLYFRKGDLDTSLKYLEDAYSRFQDAEIAAHLGEVLWLMNRREEALSIWDEGLELTPDSEYLLDTKARLTGEAHGAAE